jgi:hypothetical protein
MERPAELAVIAAVLSEPAQSASGSSYEVAMHSIIYLVGLIVVVMFVLSLLGLH